MTATRVQATRPSAPAEQAADVTEHRNEVVVAGRLAAAALAKRLPSGDEIVTWRLIVDRASKDRRKVDVVDCTAFGARVRRQALGWEVDDVIAVTGSLRRRFWRGAGGLQSRCEVEVATASRRRATTLKRPRKPG
jgi:single-strand DNA-binding protein